MLGLPAGERLGAVCRHPGRCHRAGDLFPRRRRNPERHFAI